jgi:hypothetical protein
MTGMACTVRPVSALARVRGELGQDETGQEVLVPAELVHEHRDLIGSAHANEDERAARLRCRIRAQLRHRVPLALGDGVVRDRVLEAHDDARRTVGQLPTQVVREPWTGGRAVQSGAQSGREQYLVRPRVELLRGAVEQPLPVRFVEKVEMAHRSNGSMTW